MAKRKNKKITVEAKDKKLIALQQRANELIQIRRNAPRVAIPKPIQKGWKKTFVLRDDITRTPNASIISGMLGVINNSIYSKDGTFKVKKFYSRQMEDQTLRLKSIPAHKINNYGWPDWAIKKYFTLSWVQYSTLNGAFVGSNKQYVFNFPYMFDEVVLPNMVTHLPAFDPELEKELNGIYRFMNKTNGWERLNKLHGNSKYYFDKNNTKRRAENAMLDDAIDDALNE